VCTIRSVVYRGRATGTGRVVAIKVCAESLLPEANALSGVTHGALLSPCDLAILGDGRSALVLPYAEGGDLLEAVVKSPLCEDRARAAFFRIACALRELHAHAIMHGDVKLENILLMRPGDAASAVLADMGAARRIPAGICYDPAPASRRYAAPEVIRREPCTAKADAWALGIALFAAVTGRFPPAGARAMLRDPAFAAMSDDLRDLIRGLLDPEPPRRMGMKDVVAHHWFAKIHMQSQEDRWRRHPRMQEEGSEERQAL
jgi:serine/threonine protein kinase